MLEEYEPFTLFLDRLIATGNATLTAQQIKTLLDLDAHHSDIQETLLSLGQFSQSLVAEGGGVYQRSDPPTDNPLLALAQGCSNNASAEYRICNQIGNHAAEFVSRDMVIIPLANALLRAVDGDATGAVTSAGNAIESFLTEIASHKTISLSGTGLNAKAQELKTAGILPTKLLNISKYLGHIRNAADHGIDTDIGNDWSIRNSTGLEYVLVACSFIEASIEVIENNNFVL